LKRCSALFKVRLAGSPHKIRRNIIWRVDYFLQFVLSELDHLFSTQADLKKGVFHWLKYLCFVMHQFLERFVVVVGGDDELLALAD
jgi:hypothetical protein